MAGARTRNEETIVTLYDQILEMVRESNGIALNALAKKTKTRESRLVEDLQTLEDSGLVEIRYPPLGEPRVYLREKRET